MVILYLEQCFDLQIYYMYFKIRAKVVQNTNGSIVVAAKKTPHIYGTSTSPKATRIYCVIIV